jgi:hypothetical protein
MSAREVRAWRDEIVSSRFAARGRGPKDINFEQIMRLFDPDGRQWTLQINIRLDSYPFQTRATVKMLMKDGWAHLASWTGYELEVQDVARPGHDDFDEDARMMLDYVAAILDTDLP